jgi:hypothetical protein
MRPPGLVTNSGAQLDGASGVGKMMSQSSGNIYIPPFAGVRLIECWNHFQLVPVPAVRVCYGYGKKKAGEFANINDDDIPPFADFCEPDEEIWVGFQTFRYEDGHEEQGNAFYARASVTEEEVRKSMREMEKSYNTSREQMLDLLQCFEATEDDYQYVEDNYPNYQSEPDPKATDEYDVYHARLKVMEDLQPKTVALIRVANATKDPAKRQIVEREAVQSFFAELAHYLTEDEVMAWQKSNPVGTGWMCEFGEVMREPRRQLDPINHELALNWLRQNYNRLTAKELCNSIFSRVWKWLAPGFQMTADFIKKRRERLGLTTKRNPGAPQK